MSDRIESGPDFLAAWETNRETLRHTYDPSQEHDACGVGLIAALDGTPRRDVVQAGIDALKAVWHRGAVDADGKTGDGAGIHIEIPQDFFADAVAARRRQADARADRGRPGVPAEDRPRRAGTLPADRRDRNPELRLPASTAGARCRSTSNASARRPTRRAPRSSRSCSGTPRAVTEEAFERDLYVIRRRIEKQAIAAQIPELYLCSLSCRSIIYKGMFLAEQSDRLLSRPARRALRLAASRSTTSATRPTPSPPGGWRSRSACWRTTARSTRSPATSTG